MAVSGELEEKQITCQQLQGSADELEVQIDKLSEERQRVSDRNRIFIYYCPLGSRMDPIEVNGYALITNCITTIINGRQLAHAVSK